MSIKRRPTEIAEIAEESASPTMPIKRRRTEIVALAEESANPSMPIKRRRTKIAEIAQIAAKRVTLSKRKEGLFHKASELSVLCGARVGIITFSLAGKPFLFGEDVIEDYLAHSRPKRVRFDEIVDGVESGLDGCQTAEELESLIEEYEVLQQAVARQLESLSIPTSSISSEVISDVCPCLLKEHFGCSVSKLVTPDPIKEYDSFSISASSVSSGDGAISGFCPCLTNGDFGSTVSGQPFTPDPSEEYGLLQQTVEHHSESFSIPCLMKDDSGYVVSHQLNPPDQVQGHDRDDIAAEIEALASFLFGDD